MNLPRLNYRRGLFRLWLIASVVWVVVVGLVSEVHETASSYWTLRVSLADGRTVNFPADTPESEMIMAVQPKRWLEGAAYADSIAEAPTLRRTGGPRPTIEVVLPDGRILEFPEGTDPAVIQSTVKRVLGVQAKEPAVGPWSKYAAPRWQEAPVVDDPGLVDPFDNPTAARALTNGWRAIRERPAFDTAGLEPVDTSRPPRDLLAAPGPRTVGYLITRRSGSPFEITVPAIATESEALAHGMNIAAIRDAEARRRSERIRLTNSVLIAFVPPLVLLALGAALGWSLRGFRPQP